MGMVSVWHWVVVAVILVVLGYPVARILGRLGFSRWWVLLALLPYANLVGLGRGIGRVDRPNSWR